MYALYMHLELKENEMKKLLLGLMMLLCIVTANAQYSVTLKVIDNQAGALTNNVDDNNETNVFCWAGNDDGTLYDGDWWYPMYTGELGRDNGSLLKEDGVWTWQCTFHNVAPADYSWNPHMKTIGWQAINTLYYYADDANLSFTVASDGSISGNTTLSLPLTSTQVSANNSEQYKVYANSKRIMVAGITDMTQVLVYNMAGALVNKVTTADTKYAVEVDEPGLYLVIIDGSTFKVSVN